MGRVARIRRPGRDPGEARNPPDRTGPGVVGRRFRPPTGVAGRGARSRATKPTLAIDVCYYDPAARSRLRVTPWAQRVRNHGTGRTCAQRTAV